MTMLYLTWIETARSKYTCILTKAVGIPINYIFLCLRIHVHVSTYLPTYLPNFCFADNAFLIRSQDPLVVMPQLSRYLHVSPKT
jgi:hypothetical protein